MTAVHEVVSSLEPVQPATVEGPLEPESPEEPGGKDTSSQDESMAQDSINAVDEADDHAPKPPRGTPLATFPCKDTRH